MALTRGISVLILVLAAVAAVLCEEPVDATVCQLKEDPAKFNHKLVKVTGFISHAFEDFTVFDLDCPAWPGVWLEYGGRAKSGTMYCCGVTADRSRPKQLVIEDVPIPLVEDDQFRSFDKAIQPPFRSGNQGAIVHATLLGRYFAGKQIHTPKLTFWGGYGHMGCCTLFVIQQVESADTENRSDLDYGASPDQPDIAKTGCGYQFLLPLEQSNMMLRWQQEADRGEHEWAFNDSRRVAATTLAKLANVDTAAVTGLKLTHETQGRQVYEWDPGQSNVAYMIVVSRPYVMSFYSRNPKRVAWVAIAAYRSSCSKKNSVIRLK